MTDFNGYRHLCCNVLTVQKKSYKWLMNGKVQNGTTSEKRIFNSHLHLSKSFVQQVLKKEKTANYASAVSKADWVF